MQGNTYAQKLSISVFRGDNRHQNTRGVISAFGNPNATSRHVRLVVAVGCKADIKCARPCFRASAAASSLSFGLECFNGGISTSSQSRIDALQHNVVNLQPLVEGDFA